MRERVRFSIVGGSGFRAQFFARIAQALPERFQIAGMVVRDAEKGQLIEKQYNVVTYRSLEDLLAKETPDFVVVSVSRQACPEFLYKLADRGVPALAETPPAPDLQGLLELHETLGKQGARIQVAEQYQYQPLHAARLAVVRSGKLGNVSEATVSISHSYHGVNLLRRYLGVEFEEATIRAMRYKTSIIQGPDRSGPPREESRTESVRDIAWIEFGDKLGIYDFAKEQQRSWIRSSHVAIRGDRGEILDNRVAYLGDYRTPIYYDLHRINKGEDDNLEGHYLQGVLAGEQWVYENPFIPARLYDDELGIATILTMMAEYAAGGPGFYGLAEASQDYYVAMMIEKAIETGETVKAHIQPWTK